jgi:glycosyltransferase involved in cell wall biosynthesis
MPLDDAEVVHNGIDVTAFAAASAQRAGHQSNAMRLLFAGRLDRSKGPDIAIDAVRRLVDRGITACLTLLGRADDAFAPQLRRQIADLRLGDLVVLAGAVPRQAMADAYAQHDVLVVPSRWPDPLPRVVHEAMASGLPVVASEVGGIPELVRHGENGLLVPCDDASALADALAELAPDPERRRAMGVAGRRAVIEGFAIERMLDAVEGHLEAMVFGSNGPKHEVIAS